MKNKVSEAKMKKLTTAFCVVMVLLCAGLLIGKFVLNPYTVVGDSMNPAYINGEIVSTVKFDIAKTELHIDDVIVLKSTISKKHLVKRVVGVAGDQLQIIDGRLYRNGMMVDDGLPRMNTGGMLEELTRVPEGHVVVLGDNRTYSQDSREIGAIPLENVLAVVEGKIITKQAAEAGGH